MLKNKKIKRLIAMILIVTVFFSNSSDILSQKSYANESTSDMSSTIQAIIDLFNTSETFIQQYLDQGYTLNQILSAFYKARESNLSFDEALNSLLPIEDNQSSTVTSEVYGDLNSPMFQFSGVESEQSSIVKNYNYFPVTEAVYVDRSTVTDEVYGNELNFSVLSTPEKPPILEKPPIINKSSFNEAPFSVGNNGEYISSLSGSLSLKQTDASLPGRNGMAFSLTRQYDSNKAQFYDMDFGFTTYNYEDVSYFVQVNLVRKEVLTRYNVKYKEYKWFEIDWNGDGFSDQDTAIMGSQEILKGVYYSEAEANQVASQRIQYVEPEQRITASDTRYGYNPSTFPSYIPYSNNGFSGTLYPLGSPFVISGQLTPAKTLAAPTKKCTSTIPGKYDKNGYWKQTGEESTCPITMNYVLEGHNITMSRTVVTRKECSSPDSSLANYVCTKTWESTYNGSITIPASDNRYYQQNYKGEIIKPSKVTNRRYGPWYATGGVREREVYGVTEMPWVVPEPYEGPGTNINVSSRILESFTEAKELADNLNSIPNVQIDKTNEGGKEYRYYVSSTPNATVQAIRQVGESRTYYNKTTTPKEETMYPIGKGWSWQLPYIESKDGKDYMHLTEGGVYEIQGNSLKGYDWEGLIYKTDNSITVNGETSKSVLISVDGTQKQYFTADGRILQISDAYQNSIQFIYEQNANYNRKLLSQVKDAIGNTIRITYASDQVTITQGNKTIVYKKQTQDGVELLDSVTDALGRKTTYSYKLAAAKFNLMTSYPERAISNPYALISSVVYPTGAKSIYEYEGAPVTRMTGEESMNQAYRLISRKDLITYQNGSTEDYNRSTMSYTSDMGASYGTDFTFSTVVHNGLTSTTLSYKKDFVDSNTPEQFYLSQSIEKADGKELETTYSYAKKVGGRSYFAPVPTSTSLRNNLSGDVLTNSAQYDDFGNVTQSTDERGRTTTNTYDSTKHWLISSVSDVASNSKTYSEITRTPQGKVSQVVVRKDNSAGTILQHLQSSYDNYGNPVSQTIANGTKNTTTTTDYSSVYSGAFPTSQSVTVTDVDGRKTVISTSSEYDLLTGNLTAFVNGNHHRTEYQYDALGRMVKVIYPDRNSLTASYHDQENTVTVIDELGVQSLIRWNALGLQTEGGLYKNGQYEVTQRIGYDPYSRKVWEEDALGNRTRYGYDAWSRIISTVFADSSESRVIYNDVLRTVTATDAEGYSRIESYDKWGLRLKTEEKTLLNPTPIVIERNTYDSISGLNMTQTDGNQHTTQFKYDILGQLTAVTDANGDQTRYEYDMLGNLIKMTDPQGGYKENSYDELGNRILTKDKAGQLTKSNYDANGNLMKLTDRNGNSFSYSYDTRGRLIQRSSTDETISYTYDAAGKRTTMTDRTGTTSYRYDPYTAELLQTVYPDGLQLTLEYDKNGNRTALTGPFGNRVLYSYDSLNQLKTVGTSPNEQDALYTYYLNGLQKETRLNNGVVSKNTYSGVNLTDIQQVHSQFGLSSYQYSYDNNRNITSRTQNDAVDAFTYDKLNRIQTSTLGNETYSYDKQGNRQVLVSDQLPNFQEMTNTFDSRDRLTSVTTEGDTVHYRYNGDGFMTERSDRDGTIRFYYDGNQIIAEATIVNGQPELKANYIRGQKLEAIEYSDGSKAYVQTNGHGDITELRDAAGNLLNQYQYDIWGNILSKVEQVYNPFRYSGEYYDDATGLQYLRARWYDPSIGRFISEDTYEGELLNPLSLNLYTYVQNNPLMYVDPTGHMSFKTYWYISRGSQDWFISNSINSVKSVFDGDTYLNIFNLGKSLVNGTVSIKELAGVLGEEAIQPFKYLKEHEDHIFNGRPTKDEAYSYGQAYAKAVSALQIAATSAYSSVKIINRLPKLAKSMGLSVSKINYSKLLEEAALKNDYIVGAYENGKITKLFLNKSDLGGAGHKAFLEGKEVGFGVGIYDGEIFVRGSGTGSRVGGNYITEAEKAAIKKLFSK